MCALVLCCFLLFFLQEYIAKVYRRFFVKEVTVEKTVPIFVEKEIPMIAVDRSEAHVYRLEDDLFFDADSGVLYRVDNRVKLTATLARLLQAFLDAEDYRLSVNGIMELLWPDGSVTPGNVHTAFTKMRKITSANVLNHELILGRPYIIHYADSSVVIYDDINDSIFTLIDLRDNNSVYHFGKRGEGNNEFLQVFSLCSLYGDSLIGVYDVYKRNLVEMNLRQIKQGNIQFPVLMQDSLMSLNICPTQYDTYLGLGFYENNMFSLTGKHIGSRYYYEYPYRDKQEKEVKNRLRGMAYQGTLSSNKSLNRFVFAIGSAPIFSLYSVNKDNIDKSFEFVGGYPEYKTEDTGTTRSAPMSVANKMAFIKAYATEKYVYLLYSGNSYKEVGVKAFNGKIIYQLAWDATPICKFVLDFPIMNFCVSDSDDTIYALMDKEEVELVKYSLNL